MFSLVSVPFLAIDIDQFFIALGSFGNKLGSSWLSITGGMRQISCGPLGVVFGVNARKTCYLRRNITENKPEGKDWKVVGIGVRYVSCGVFGCWGIKGASQVFLDTRDLQERTAGNVT